MFSLGSCFNFFQIIFSIVFSILWIISLIPSYLGRHELIFKFKSNVQFLFLSNFYLSSFKQLFDTLIIYLFKFNHTSFLRYNKLKDFNI